MVDASGKQWLNETIDHEVGEGFYKNPRNDGKDPYDPAFDKAAQAIIEALLKQKQSELAQLQNINDLRFAASFNEQAFNEYLDTSGQQIKLVSMPSDADPMFERVKSIQVREQLFVDNLQQNYSAFSQQMDESYLAWQEASATEMQLRKEAKTKSIWKMIGWSVSSLLKLFLGADAHKINATQNTLSKMIISNVLKNNFRLASLASAIF